MCLGPPVTVCDLLLSCSFAVTKLMAPRQTTPRSEEASGLNSTRSCLFMLAETSTPFSKKPYFRSDVTLTFQCRTGKDQDDQNQKKHVPNRHCRPRGTKRKTQKLGLHSVEYVYSAGKKRAEIVSKVNNFYIGCIKIPLLFL